MTQSETNIVSIDVYFDFLCPFAYNAAVWLGRVKEEMGDKLTVNWKYFSLEQVNNQQGQDWKIWEQTDDYPSRGLPAFRATEAARRQGETAFNAYHTALYYARHEQGRDIADTSTLVDVAGNAGLDVALFSKDFRERKLLNKLAEDHTYAVETLGIFGTPTIVFAENQAVFLKMSAPPASLPESVTFFNELRSLAENRRDILEIKRP